MPKPTEEELLRWTTAKEGQFFERKSALHGEPGKKAPRKPADVAMDVAETLAAMANADGGELVVGIDDNGSVSGVTQPEDRLAVIFTAPKSKNYVNPPLPVHSRELRTTDGHRLFHFEVSWSPDVHQLAGSRYLLRVNDKNSPFPAEQIAALKSAKTQGLWERTYPPGATMADLDMDLIASLAPAAWAGRNPEDVLRDRGLIAGRNGHSVPSNAALLLFSKTPARWHPRCGIDFVRWQGTERKQGADFNAVKRFPIEASLSTLIRKAYDAILPILPERTNLQDLLFNEKLVYPVFAWQEAIVNAVAHRDYGIQGAGTEIWLFDDRLEIRSPGLPPGPVTLDALTRREHIHVSRNPYIVRTLVELGYMREAGEGIPRMFDEMERAGFYPPALSIVGGMSFQVTLRNQPLYDQATIKWLHQYDGIELSMDQKRVLASGHAHADRFTSRDVQELLHTDIYGASNLIKDLIRKGAVRSPEKGSRIYQVIEPLAAKADTPVNLVRLLPLLNRVGFIRNQDLRKELHMTRITATRALQEWVASGWLLQPKASRGAGAVYPPGPKLLHHAPVASSTLGTDAIPPYGDAKADKGKTKGRD